MWYFFDYTDESGDVDSGGGISSGSLAGHYVNFDYYISYDFSDVNRISDNPTAGLRFGALDLTIDPQLLWPGWYTGYVEGLSDAFWINEDANTDVNATIQAYTDDTIGEFTTTQEVNAVISARTDDTTSAFSANVATNGTIQGYLDDTTGAFTAEVVNPGTNATIQGYTDDTIGSFFATVTGDVLPTNGGAIIQNLRRHTERYKRRKEAEEKERQDNVDQQLKKIVADTPKPSKALKAAYKAIRLGQDELDNAEQRLMAYLLVHEQEMKEEMAIITLIAELL